MNNSFIIKKPSIEEVCPHELVCLGYAFVEVDGKARSGREGDYE